MNVYAQIILFSTNRAPLYEVFLSVLLKSEQTGTYLVAILLHLISLHSALKVTDKLNFRHPVFLSSSICTFNYNPFLSKTTLHTHTKKRMNSTCSPVGTWVRAVKVLKCIWRVLVLPYISLPQCLSSSEMV